MRAHPHYNPYSIRVPSEKPDWQSVFPTQQPLDLEIGFSNGTWLIDYAAQNPTRNVTGVETRSIFIAEAKARIVARGLTNAYALQANASTALTELFSLDSLSRIFVLFPDPWYKGRHLRRRVIQPAFLEMIYPLLTMDGELYIATDKQDFSLDMLRDVEASGLFTNVAGANNYVEQTIPGVTTDIERYHLRLQHPIYRLQFKKLNQIPGDNDTNSICR